MVGGTECFNKFKEIKNGKENQGYLEWKKWVLKRVEDYDEDKLINLIKRLEIRKDLISEGDTCQSLFKDIMPLLTVLLTLFVTLLITPMTNMFEVYNANVEKELIDEYANMVVKMSLENSEEILVFCMIYIGVFLLILLIEKWCERKTTQANAILRVYYRELLEILREQLKKVG